MVFVGTSASAPRVVQSAQSVADAIAQKVEERRRAARAYLVGISGIDGSGKSHSAGIIARALETRGLRVAPIGIDVWQNPQSIRFGGSNPGQHFYEHVIRFDALFAELIEPLTAHRSIRLVTQGIRTDQDVWDELIYDFVDIDVVLVEGILLFKRALVDRYDLRVWIECSFETAVSRALARNVERLPAERLRDDYENTYHAAQRHHIAIDDPCSAVDIMLNNDAAPRS
jgi:uridine kinase